MPAMTNVMPRFLARQNAHATPIAALITTTVSIQLLLLVVLVVDNALDFMLKLDTALSLIPYLLAAGYALKLTITRETYSPEDESSRKRNQLVAALAVAYAALLLYSAGLEYLMLACIIYAPGTLLYLAARREAGGGSSPGSRRSPARYWSRRLRWASVLISSGVIDV